MMNNIEMFKLANNFGSRVRVMANDSCFEFWTDGLEKFAEAYHLAKCANNAPIGYVSEWEGDVSDTNNFIFVEKLDELDDSTNWIPVFAVPQANTEPNSWISVELKNPPLYTSVLFYREDAGVFEGKLTELANELSEQYIKQYEISEEEQCQLDYFCYTAEGGLCRLEGSEAPTHWKSMPNAPALVKLAESKL